SVPASASLVRPNTLANTGRLSKGFRTQAIDDYLFAVQNNQTRSESLVSRMDRAGRRAVLFRASRLGSLNSKGRKRPNALWRPLPAQSRAAVYRFYRPILQTILQREIASLRVRK